MRPPRAHRIWKSRTAASIAVSKLCRNEWKQLRGVFAPASVTRRLKNLPNASGLAGDFLGETGAVNGSPPCRCQGYGRSASASLAIRQTQLRGGKGPSRPGSPCWPRFPASFHVCVALKI